MQMFYEDGQVSMFAPDSCAGKTSPAHSPAGSKREMTSGSSWRKHSELVYQEFMFLKITLGDGDILGQPYWEILSPYVGESSTLNTGVCPRVVRGSSLWQILEPHPQRKYYLSRKACLGILRRARKRGKELPATLKLALEMQSGLRMIDLVILAQMGLIKAYHINQRNEGIDLGDTAGALMATSNLQMQTFVAGTSVAFAANQRDEVRDLGDKAGALGAQPGMKQQTFVLQGNMIGRKDENGPQGDGVNEDVCFTLDATDRHAVCAPEDVYAMTTGSYMQVAKEVAPTLMARDYKDPTTIAPAPHLNEGVMGTVATGAHPSGFNGQDAFNDRLVIDNPEAQPTPVTYTVRRLTPTECARLQGFPDWWCRDLGTENPTEEELAFWADVFETHRKIVTHAKKPKTEKQIRKWLADPYTDSAEYRIWGNGICLANAFFVLAGIAWCAGLEE